jgi:cobalt transporter subunit CbtB
MTTQTTTVSASKSEILPILLAAVFGFAMIVIAGHVQASSLHDAAHDVRHATGFPCH